MNVSGPDQMTIMTAMMAQQVQQLAEIQEMIAETTAKLVQVSADPNIGRNQKDEDRRTEHEAERKPRVARVEELQGDNDDLTDRDGGKHGRP